MDRSLTLLVENVEALARTIGEAEQERRATLIGIDERTATRVREELQVPIDTLGEAIKDLHRGLNSLPNDLAAKIGAAVPESLSGFRKALDKLNEGVAGLPQEVALQVGKAVRSEKPHDNRPPSDQPSEVGPALKRLAVVLEAMEERAERPIWKRLVGRNGRRGRQ
jgi:paraquat-inducible protein B